MATQDTKDRRDKLEVLDHEGQLDLGDPRLL